MNIDFKGYQYAVVTIQGGVLHLTNNHNNALGYRLCEDNAHKIMQNLYYKEEKQMENVYTQEMYKAGEFPKAGMKVLWLSDGEFVEVEVISVSKCTNPVITFLYRLQCDCVYWHKGSGFKSIEARTDKEKAIGDLNSLFENLRNMSVDNNSVSILKAIINGEIHGVTFTENKND